MQNSKSDTFLGAVERRLASPPSSAQVAYKGFMGTKDASGTAKPPSVAQEKGAVAYQPKLNTALTTPSKKVLVGMKNGQAVYEDEDENDPLTQERKYFESKYGSPPQ